MDEITLKELLAKYREGTSTAEEKALLENWISNTTYPEYQISEKDLTDDLAAIRETLPVTGKTRRLWPRIAAAASIILALSAGSYFLLHKQPQQQTAQNKKQDIAPGHNQATLTLANGQKIVLTRGLNGKLAQQGTTAITVNAGNAIAYQSQPATAESVIQYNTLSTARGEQSPYPLILPDGTKAWLNAASSITFPTAFAGKDRTVTVTGEAYFEVVHNSAKPFRVKIKDQIIEDIGTHFNINGYDDEPVISTTLIEGSVKVYTANASAILKPGQQSNASNGRIKVAQVDADDAIAWKEGYFQFNTDNLESGMRKIARWYNVDVEYKNDAVRKQALAGTISKYSNVSQVLKKMELTGAIHLSLSGHKIIVE